MLKPQDALVCLKLLAAKPAAISSYPQLAEALFLSVSETHAAVRRARRAGLLIAAGPDLHAIRPCRPALEEFLCFGLRYVYPAELGPIAIGMATAESMAPLVGQLLTAEGALPTIWRSASGNVRGASIEPLYRTVPEAANADPVLYEWLALVDALRLHRGRIAGLAQDAIRLRLVQRRHAIAA